MIVQFYRSNQPALLLTVPFVGAVVWAMHFFDTSWELMPQGFVFDFLFEHASLPNWGWKLIALSLLILTAIQLNYLINEQEIFTKTTHIPLLFTLVFGSYLSQRGGLEPFLVANFFMVPAIRSLMRIYHQNTIIALTFDAGLWIGLAAIFEPIYILTLIVAVISIFTLRAADWREITFLFIGFGMPFLFLFTLLFVIDAKFPIPTFSLENLQPKIPFQDSPWFLSFSGLLLFLFLKSILFYLKGLSNIILRVRKQRIILLYFSVTFIVIFTLSLLTQTQSIPSSILLIPLVFLCSYHIIHTPTPILLDIQHYIIFALWGVFVYKLYFL